MKLYFVRHGESVANLLHEFSNSGWKHPLTEQGVAQARATADALSGLQADRIYSSPVLRAAQTANILADRLRAPVEIAEALREWSVGVYEGTTDPAGWELHSRVQEDWFARGLHDSKMPGGESFAEIRARFVPFIENLLSYKEKTALVLVGHGGLYMAMLPVILRNVDHPFAQRHGFPYTGVTIAEARSDGLYCLSWCGAIPGA